MTRHRAPSPRMRVVIKQLAWIVDVSCSTAMLRQEPLLVALGELYWPWSWFIYSGRHDPSYVRQGSAELWVRLERDDTRREPLSMRRSGGIWLSHEQSNTKL